MKMTWFLGGVFTLFCMILLVCWGISRQANPVFLDQNGHPTNVAASTK